MAPDGTNEQFPTTPQAAVLYVCYLLTNSTHPPAHPPACTSTHRERQFVAVKNAHGFQEFQQSHTVERSHLDPHDGRGGTGANHTA